jgi:16S rRNA (guanine(966)-N(2))-methyltransferase RsmD
MTIGAIVKVCSGTAKGIVLKSPPGVEVRPTSARVRQAVFSVLSDKLGGSFVLDLYAGTGAMGIEALSRGAARAVFVERSPRCLKAIRENLERTNFSGEATVLAGDALRILHRLRARNLTFDLVIADPPYETQRGPRKKPSLVQKTLNAVAEGGILRSDSVVIFEHSETGSRLQPSPGLKLQTLKKYGSTCVSIFRPA